MFYFSLYNHQTEKYILSWMQLIFYKALNLICLLIDQDLYLLDESLENNFIQFLSIINDYVRQKNTCKAQSLAIMVLQSIIFNLYAKNKEADKVKLNNSFYHSMAMSMSQMSMDLNEQSMIRTDQVNKLSTFIQSLVMNKKFSKKLKVIGERHHHKARNIKYIEIFLQTMEYIMNKQKLAKDHFYDIKKVFATTVISKEEIKSNITLVNNVIFSNRLNKIIFLLTQSDDEVYYALTRIYYVCSKQSDRRNFREIKYSAVDMVHNLYKQYILSFSSKIQVFKEGQNPLYKLIVTHLQCLYMPQLIKFNQIILKCSKNQIGGIEDFLRIAESTVVKELVELIDNFPNELIKLLNSLYNIIQHHFNGDRNGSCVAIKRLFIYSFLLKSDIVDEMFLHQADFSLYEQSCNYIVNLFFPASVKKFPSQYTKSMERLIEIVSNRFDMRIINYTNNTQQNIGYFLQQPVINDDYQILANCIKIKDFTPKDMKQFQMSKYNQFQLNKTYSNNNVVSEINQSPIVKHIKKDIEINSQKNNYDDQEIDLAVWMTVGGKYDWKNHQRAKLQINKKKTPIFQTFPKQKIKQIEQLQQKFKNISNGII